MAKVRVYRVKYVHHGSALLTEDFTVSQLVFHPKCPDTAARDNLLGPANPLVSEAQDFLSRVIEAVTAYGSAEQLRSGEGPLLVHKQAPPPHRKDRTAPPPNKENF